jgi:outer membrane protein assembly factor BamB
MKHKLLLAILSSLIIFSCKTVEPTITKSSQKEVTALSLTGIANATSIFDQATNTYTFTVPNGTNIKALAFTFTLPTGATSVPASGSTQDFTNPVIYMITAEDGSKQSIKVILVITSSSTTNDKDILVFGTGVDSFNGLPHNVDGHLYAVDAKNGKLIWIAQRKNGGGPRTGFPSSPTISDGMVYVGSNDGNFYAFDLITGKEKWNHDDFKYENITSSPVVYNELVYYSSVTDFYALDKKTGVKKWVFEKILNNFSFCLSDGVIYGSAGNNIYSIDANSGSIRWFKILNENIKNSTYNLKISNDLLVCRGDDGFVTMDKKTGIIKWSNKISMIPLVFMGRGVYGLMNQANFTIYNSKIYTYGIENLAKVNNVFFAEIELSNGNISHKIDQNFTTDISHVSTAINTPLIYNNTFYSFFTELFYSNFTHFKAINLSNYNVNWEFEGALYSSPLIANNTIYFTHKDKEGQHLKAIDATTGKEIWRYKYLYQDLKDADGQIQPLMNMSSPCLITQDGKIFHSGVNGYY